MKKTFGIIGAGLIAKTLAKFLINSGNNVIISNTSKEKLNQVTAELGERAKAVSIKEAASEDIVILALPFAKVPELGLLFTSWDNRIVIDATNHFINADFQVAELNGRDSTAVVADHLPGARVVKAFNTLFYKVLEQEPQQNGGKRVLFLSGDHQEANQEIAALIETFGFAPVDLGSLSTGGVMQQAKGPLASLNLIKLK